jgi:hypothetical protein
MFISSMRVFATSIITLLFVSAFVLNFAHAEESVAEPAAAAATEAPTSEIVPEPVLPEPIIVEEIILSESQPETTPVEEESAPSETQDAAPSAPEDVPAEVEEAADESPAVVEAAADEAVLVEPTPEEQEVPVVEEQVAAVANFGVPTLTTDKEDYHPGETATIFGKFFGAFQNIVLKIFGSDDNEENYTEEVQGVFTDGAGEFSTLFNLDNLYRPYYEVIAYSTEGEVLAESFFRDSSVGAYDQCSNDDGDGYAGGDTGCRWITGAIGQSNSTYYEGDSTPQRVWLEGFAPNTSHTVTFKYGTTKAGKHAYDYLTSYGASENWILDADKCDDITG